MKKSTIGAALAFITSALVTTTASALPSLQLGPNCDPGNTSTCGGWTYVGGGDDTWYYNGAQPATLMAYANATAAEGGNGDYAWMTEPDPNQYAYLVIATVPDLGAGDAFDVSVSGATLVASGYGSPPLEDPNSLSPHSIFDTYFEIYEFQFAGLETIENTQPPGGDPGQGYAEAIGVTLNSSVAGLTGLHFDLFTVASGQYAPGGALDNKLVQAFAPYSHDAQLLPPDTPPPPPPPQGVPEPGILALFGIGMAGMGVMRRRRKQD